MDPRTGVTNVRVILLDLFIEDGSSHQHPANFTGSVQKIVHVTDVLVICWNVQKMDPRTDI
jgi:hypothetical protein